MIGYIVSIWFSVIGTVLLALLGDSYVTDYVGLHPIICTLGAYVMGMLPCAVRRFLNF